MQTFVLRSVQIKRLVCTISDLSTKCKDIYLVPSYLLKKKHVAIGEKSVDKIAYLSCVIN